MWTCRHIIILHLPLIEIKYKSDPEEHGGREVNQPHYVSASEEGSFVGMDKEEEENQPSKHSYKNIEGLEELKILRSEQKTKKIERRIGMSRNLINL